MSFHARAIDRALSASLGEDDPLVRELREAFVEAAVAILARLAEAQDETEWHDAAIRMQSLAASFGAEELLDAARGAVRSPLAVSCIAAVRDAVELAAG